MPQRNDLLNNLQPIVINHHKGRMALAHNGNLTNSYELRYDLEEKGYIFHTTTDSEVIAYIIVQDRLHTPSIEEAVYEAMGRIEGAYSLVISSPTKLIAVRDPHGFRPLCMGKTPEGKIVFASETCALTPSVPILSVMYAPVRSLPSATTVSRRTRGAAAASKNTFVCLNLYILQGLIPP